MYHREGLQPPSKAVKLLYPTPDVAFPEHALRLLATYDNENALFRLTDKLFIYKKETCPQIEGTPTPQLQEALDSKKFFTGNFVIFDRKTGLANYAANYLRNTEEKKLSIVAIQSWGHQVKESASFSKNSEIETSMTFIRREVNPKRGKEQWVGDVTLYKREFDSYSSHLGELVKNTDFVFPTDQILPTALNSVAEQVKLLEDPDYTISLYEPRRRFEFFLGIDEKQK